MGSNRSHGPEASDTGNTVAIQVPCHRAIVAARVKTKRRRTMIDRTSLGKVRTRIWIGQWLRWVVVLALFRTATAQSYCFRSLSAADTDRDGQLSNVEYLKFLKIYTDNGLSDPIPSAVVAPFVKLGQAIKSSDALPIQGIKKQSGELYQFAKLLCDEVRESLMTEFRVTVKPEVCISSLKMADQVEPKGSLTPDQEFVPFLYALTREPPLKSGMKFAQLPKSIQAVFIDMQQNGVVSAGAGQNYLMEFCERSVLAVGLAMQSSSKEPPATEMRTGTKPTTKNVSQRPQQKNQNARAKQNQPRSSQSADSGQQGTILQDKPKGKNTFVLNKPPKKPMKPMMGKKPMKLMMMGQNKNKIKFNKGVESQLGTAGPAAGKVSSNSSQSELLSSDSHDEEELVEQALEESDRDNKGETKETTKLKASDGDDIQGNNTVSITTATYSTTATEEGAYNRSTTRADISSMSPRQFQQCKTAILLADSNRNDLLEKDEFDRFADRFHNDLFATSVDEEAEVDYGRAYQTILEQQGKRVAPSVRGSRPGQAPTHEESQNLWFLCDESFKVLDTANQRAMDTGNTKTSRKGSTSVGDVSEEFWSTCKTALFVSDKNDDSALDKVEFVGLVHRLEPETRNVGTYGSLDEVFHKAFESSNRGGFIDVVGSRPGSVASPTEVDRLRNLCISFSHAVAAYNEKHPPDKPTGNSYLSPETDSELSSLDDRFYRGCKMAMFIADNDRDDLLSQDEFTVFVDRLSYGAVQVRSFDDLDPLFQVTFDIVSGDIRMVDVRGSKPGNQLTTEQDRALRSVCHAIDGAITDFTGVARNTTTPPEEPEPQVDPSTNDTSYAHEESVPVNSTREIDVLPMNATTVSFEANTVDAQDASPKISYTEFKKCKTEMLKADQDGNSQLSGNEFVALIAAMTKGSLGGTSFDNLSPTYHATFLDLSVDREYISISGTSFVDKPTKQESDHLKTVCLGVYESIEHFKYPSSKEQDCIYKMYISDANADSVLSENEYVPFLNSLANTGMQYKDQEFANLPYFLRENFQWSKSFGEFVDIHGSDMKNVDDETLQRLERMCQRTKRILDSPSPAPDLDNYCNSSMITADRDKDGYLDENEYASLISGFTENWWEGTEFSSLHPLIKDYFNETQEVSIENATKEDGSMAERVSHYCLGLETSIRKARRSELFVEHCQETLTRGDHDGDNSLSMDEFAPFLFDLAFKDMSKDQLNTISFAGMTATIQESFANLASQNQKIDLNGLLEQDLSQFQSERLQSVCNSIHDTAMVELQNSTVRVKNSFVISNGNGTAASDVTNGLIRDRLEQAYASFVEEKAGFLATASMDHGRRSLTVLGASRGSSRIHLVTDSPCPNSATNGARCQRVFASFDIIQFNETDLESIADSMSVLTQNAIDQGDLQEKLKSYQPLKVLESSLPLDPDDFLAQMDSPTLDPVDSLDSVILKTGAVTVMMFTGLFAFGLTMFGIYYGRQINARTKDDELLQKLEEEEEALYEYEEDYGLLPEQVERNKKERALRRSVVPLLLTQSYVSPLNPFRPFLTYPQHLPGYTYGQDLFQYIYNAHPVFGIFWRHRLHPIRVVARVICLLGSCLCGLAITNIVFIVFEAAGWDFDENYGDLVGELDTGKDAFDAELEAAASSLSYGNIVLWTIGSSLHALFDSSLWSIATCSCFRKGDLIEKIERYQKLGTKALVITVAGVAGLAIGTTYVRVALAGRLDYDFLEAYGVEITTTYFLYYPLISCVLFSGLLGPCHEELLGGRPYAVKKDDLARRRKKREDKRSQLLESRLIYDSGNTMGTAFSAFGNDLQMDGTIPPGLAPTGQFGVYDQVPMVFQQDMPAPLPFQSGGEVLGQELADSGMQGSYRLNIRAGNHEDDESTLGFSVGVEEQINRAASHFTGEGSSSSGESRRTSNSESSRGDSRSSRESDSRRNSCTKKTSPPKSTRPSMASMPASSRGNEPRRGSHASFHLMSQPQQSTQIAPRRSIIMQTNGSFTPSETTPQYVPMAQQPAISMAHGTSYAPSGYATGVTVPQVPMQGNPTRRLSYAGPLGVTTGFMVPQVPMQRNPTRRWSAATPQGRNSGFMMRSRPTGAVGSRRMSSAGIGIPTQRRQSQALLSHPQSVPMYPQRRTSLGTPQNVPLRQGQRRSSEAMSQQEYQARINQSYHPNIGPQY